MVPSIYTFLNKKENKKFQILTAHLILTHYIIEWIRLYTIFTYALEVGAQKNITFHVSVSQ